MKPLLASTFALLVLVTLAPSANADQSCSVATLKGNYTFSNPTAVHARRGRRPTGERVR
jgi:hypothetical protein